MYELVHGSHRLVGALDRCQGDKERIAALADVLYYVPEQLEQDIQALYDYIHQLESEK